MDGSEDGMSNLPNNATGAIVNLCTPSRSSLDHCDFYTRSFRKRTSDGHFAAVSRSLKLQVVLYFSIVKVKGLEKSPESKLGYVELKAMVDARNFIPKFLYTRADSANIYDKKQLF
jgi:hypothetical protein